MPPSPGRSDPRESERQPSVNRGTGWQGSGDPGEPTALMRPQVEPVAPPKEKPHELDAYRRGIRRALATHWPAVAGLAIAGAAIALDVVEHVFIVLMVYVLFRLDRAAGVRPTRTAFILVVVIAFAFVAALASRWLRAH